VLKVQWSPFHTGIFGSSGQDRKLMVWDISRCDTVNPNQSDSSLLVSLALKQFTHSGHRSKIPDFDWSPHEKLVVGSV